MTCFRLALRGHRRTHRTSGWRARTSPPRRWRCGQEVSPTPTRWRRLLWRRRRRRRSRPSKAPKIFREMSVCFDVGVVRAGGEGDCILDFVRSWQNLLDFVHVLWHGTSVALEKHAGSFFYFALTCLCFPLSLFVLTVFYRSARHGDGTHCAIREGHQGQRA